MEHLQHGDHIGLLENLGVGGHAVSAAPVFLGVQKALAHLVRGSIFQVKVPVKLGDDAALPRLGHVQLLRRLGKPGQKGLRVGLPAEGIVGRRVGLPQKLRRLDRPSEGLPGHAVGIGVVVDPLVVLIRADHIQNFPAVTGGAPDQQGVIEPCALQHRPRAALDQQAVVPGGERIEHHRPGHGGGNMDLLIPEEGPHGTLGEHVRHVVVGAGVKAALLALPGVKRTLPAIGFCLLQGPGQSLNAVAHHGPGHLGLGIQEVVQDEHFAVPEDSPLIGLSGEAPSGDRQIVPVAGGDRIEVVEGVVDLILGLLIALDLHRAPVPNGLPGVLVGRKQLLPGSGFRQLRANRLQRPGRVIGGIDRADAGHGDRPAGLKGQAVGEGTLPRRPLRLTGERTAPSHGHIIPVVLDLGQTEEGIPLLLELDVFVMGAVNLPDVSVDVREESHFHGPVNAHSVAGGQNMGPFHVDDPAALQRHLSVRRIPYRLPGGNTQAEIQALDMGLGRPR